MFKFISSFLENVSDFLENVSDYTHTNVLSNKIVFCLTLNDNPLKERGGTKRAILIIKPITKIHKKKKKYQKTIYFLSF